MSARERIGLAALLVAALGIRAATVLSLEGDPYFYEPIVDAAQYDAWATEIAAQDFIGKKAFYQDPLYPYGLGIFYAIFGRDLLWARLVQGLLGTLGLWMLFEGVRRFLGYRTAIAALAMGAFYKTFVFYDGALLKDFLGVIAVEAAILFWSLEAKWKWAAFGAALGLGTLVRGNMLLLALVAAGALAFRRDWRSAALTLAGAAACIAPVTIRNAIVAKDFVLTTAQLGPNLYTGNHPENTSGRYRPPPFLEAGATQYEERDFRAEAERLNRRPMKASEIDAYWRNRAIDYILRNPGTFVAVTAKRLLMLSNAFEIPDDHDPAFMARYSWALQVPMFTFGFFLAPLAAAGFYLAWTERSKFSMLFLLAGSYVFSIAFFFVFARYRMPVLPFLLVFAAHGAVKGAQLVAWRMRKVPRIAAVVFVVALVVVNVPLPEAIGGHRDFRAAHGNLAKHHFEHGKAEEAVREFEEAARLNPAYLAQVPFVWTYANACERAGRETQAFELYERYSELDRSDAEGPYRVGKIYFARGLYDRAEAKLAEALRRDPALAAAAIDLAETQVRLKKPDAAIQTLAAAGPRAPGIWGIALKRAEIYRGLSMWKESLAAAEEVLILSPAQPEAIKIRDESRRQLR